MKTGEIDKVFAGLDTKLRKFKEAWGVEFKDRVERRTPVITGMLKGGWGFTMKATDIEIYNTQPYASFVEYGTVTMAPRGMMRVTLLESPQITEVAAKKVGLK
jgi:hypothetical protein